MLSWIASLILACFVMAEEAKRDIRCVGLSDQRLEGQLFIFNSSFNLTCDPGGKIEVLNWTYSIWDTNCSILVEAASTCSHVEPSIPENLQNCSGLQECKNDITVNILFSCISPHPPHLLVEISYECDEDNKTSTVWSAPPSPTTTAPGSQKKMTNTRTEFPAPSSSTAPTSTTPAPSTSTSDSGIIPTSIGTRVVIITLSVISGGLLIVVIVVVVCMCMYRRNRKYKARSRKDFPEHQHISGITLSGIENPYTGNLSVTSQSGTPVTSNTYSEVYLTEDERPCQHPDSLRVSSDLDYDTIGKAKGGRDTDSGYNEVCLEDGGPVKVVPTNVPNIKKGIRNVSNDTNRRQKDNYDHITLNSNGTNVDNLASNHVSDISKRIQVGITKDDKMIKCKESRDGENKMPLKQTKIESSTEDKLKHGNVALESPKYHSDSSNNNIKTPEMKGEPEITTDHTANAYSVDGDYDTLERMKHHDEDKAGIPLSPTLTCTQQQTEDTYNRLLRDKSTPEASSTGSVVKRLSIKEKGDGEEQIMLTKTETNGNISRNFNFDYSILETPVNQLDSFNHERSATRPQEVKENECTTKHPPADKLTTTGDYDTLKRARLHNGDNTFTSPFSRSVSEETSTRSDLKCQPNEEKTDNEEEDTQGHIKGKLHHDCFTLESTQNVLECSDDIKTFDRRVLRAKEENMSNENDCTENSQPGDGLIVTGDYDTLTRMKLHEKGKTVTQSTQTENTHNRFLKSKTNEEPSLHEVTMNRNLLPANVDEDRDKEPIKQVFGENKGDTDAVIAKSHEVLPGEKLIDEDPYNYLNRT